MTGDNTTRESPQPRKLDSQTEKWNREIEQLRNQSKERMAEAQDPQTRQRIEEEFAREIQQRQDYIKKAGGQSNES